MDRWIPMHEHFFSALFKTDELLTKEEGEARGRRIFMSWFDHRPWYWLILPSKGITTKSKEEIIQFFQAQNLSVEDAEKLFSAILGNGFIYNGECDEFVVVKLNNQKGDVRYQMRYVESDRM